MRKQRSDPTWFSFILCAFVLTGRPAAAQQSRWTDVQPDTGKFVMLNSEDHHGNLWLSGEEHGVSRFDGQSWTLFNDSNTAGLLDNFCYAIACDGNDNVWCGTGRKGVAVYDGKSWKKYDIYDGLAGWHVYSLAVSPKDGKVWIGTEAGVSVWNGAAFTNYTREKDGVCSNQICGIVFDRASGDLWVGGYENGVSRFDGSGGSTSLTTGWRTYTTSNSPLVSDQTNSLYIDSRNSLWIMTHGGISQVRDRGATWSKPIKIPVQVTDQYITCATEDLFGNMWFGTRRDGVWVLDVQKSQWRSYTKESSGLPDNFVTCLLARQDGAIWAGTYGGGAASIKPYPATVKPAGDRRQPPPPLKPPAEIESSGER